MANRRATTLLNRLIETCRDAHAGYRTAAHSVTDLQLKQLLGRFSRRRQLFCEQLCDEVRRLGAEPPEHGSMGGALHRGWMQLSEELHRATPRKVLRECLRGEAHSLKLYRTALEQEWPSATRRMLAIHVERMAASCERMRALQKDLP